MPGNTFGGRVIFDYDGLRIPPCDADIVINPSLMQSEAKANQDGSAAYMLKPMLAGADIKFRNAAEVDWGSIVLKVGNINIVEENTNRTHLFTGCRLVGYPKVNVSNGEVDGLRVEGPQYKLLGT